MNCNNWISWNGLKEIVWTLVAVTHLEMSCPVLYLSCLISRKTIAVTKSDLQLCFSQVQYRVYLVGVRGRQVRKWDVFLSNISFNDLFFSHPVIIQTWRDFFWFLIDIQKGEGERVRRVPVGWPHRSRILSLFSSYLFLLILSFFKIQNPILLRWPSVSPTIIIIRSLVALVWKFRSHASYHLCYTWVSLSLDWCPSSSSFKKAKNLSKSPENWKKVRSSARRRPYESFTLKSVKKDEKGKNSMQASQVIVFFISCLNTVVHYSFLVSSLGTKILDSFLSNPCPWKEWLTSLTYNWLIARKTGEENKMKGRG